MALVCIKANQVFSACQEKDCPTVVTTVPVADIALITGITFENGTISVPILTLIPGKIDCYRAEFEVSIPYSIAGTGGAFPYGGSIVIPKDIILYIPKSLTRPEFVFEYAVETLTQVLVDFYVGDGSPDPKVPAVVFLAGALIVIKVSGEVQLQIEAVGNCPEPCICEEYTDENLCEEFKEVPFPDNFFPPFPTDLCPEVNCPNII